jgi:hypothetical protein
MGFGLPHLKRELDLGVECDEGPDHEDGERDDAQEGHLLEDLLHDLLVHLTMGPVLDELQHALDHEGEQHRHEQEQADLHTGTASEFLLIIMPGFA